MLFSVWCGVVWRVAVKDVSKVKRSKDKEREEKKLGSEEGGEGNSRWVISSRVFPLSISSYPSAPTSSPSIHQSIAPTPPPRPRSPRPRSLPKLVHIPAAPHTPRVYTHSQSITPSHRF